MDVDADDGLAGRQVLNVLNAVYSRPSAPWIVTTTFIKINPSGTLSRGFSKKFKGSVSDYRRGTESFRTSHLKTYLADLEAKIPMEYLTDIDQVNGQNVTKYPRYSSDSAMMFSMLEMAGNQRYEFLPHIFYHYRQTKEFYDICHHSHQFYDGEKKRSLVPLQPLSSLTDTPRPITNKTFPSIDLETAKKTYLKDCQITVDNALNPEKAI